MARTLGEDERLALIDALADGDWHSGEALAEQFGVTRAGLSKRVAHLRDWGLEVETRSGRGYRLAGALERLDEARIRERLPDGLALQVLPSTDSTNRVATQADGACDPQAFLAEHQSAGRGRRGRSWQSPFGANLYLSLAWSWPLWPPQLPALSLVVGVAAAQSLRAIGVQDVGLKWPNDLWVGGRKLGGILIEQTGEAGGNCRVIVGIGINVAMQATQGSGIDQPWTTVDAALGTLAPTSRNQLASELLCALHAALSRFASEGLAPWREAWSRLDVLRDLPVTTLDAPVLTGTGAGIDDIGAYRIATADGLRTVYAGDVSLRPA